MKNTSDTGQAFHLLSGWLWVSVLSLAIFGGAAFWALQIPSESWKFFDEGIKRFERISKVLTPVVILLGVYVALRRAAAADKAADTSVEGQITERFTKAIEQLGDRDRLAVRLGGIYALERIAHDSRRDHWTVMEVLCTYLQTECPRPSGSPISERRHLSVDVQAILAVLRRRRYEYEKEGQQLDLGNIDLGGAILGGAILKGANLEGAILRGTDLEEGNLESANLVCVNLKDANLKNANLSKARLKGSNLKASFEGADLWEAHLEYSILQRANLEAANLRSANLEGANLTGAVLKTASLFRANLEGANLQAANLEGANLQSANLLTANLKSANLDGAFLKNAVLRGANLSAGLRGANLWGANLEYAILQEANLEGAVLKNARLEGASLEGANLARTLGLTREQIQMANGDGKTVLPQGLERPSHWSDSASDLQEAGAGYSD